jgi:NitT/TauT family transport system permease protein
VAAHLRSFLFRYYSIPLLLILWQLSVNSGLIQSRLLPSLSTVCSVLFSEIANGSLLYQALITVSRALVGFAVAFLVGIPFAIAMARSKWWRDLFEPTFLLTYPIPKIALFPIFTYIFGIGTPSKISFAALECLYPIVITSYFGFRAIPSRLIWTAQNMGASKLKTFFRVIVPASLPSIFSGLRVALPVSIVVVVLTEMIGDSVGLGFYITNWSTRFSFAHVYAAIILIGCIGLALDQILLALRRHFVYWQRDASPAQ